MAVNVAGCQLLAQVAVGGNILHRNSRHRFIIAEYMRNIFRRKLTLQFQNLRHDLIAIEVQRTAGAAQQLICLFDYDAASVLQGLYTRNIINIAVTDFRAGKLLTRLKLVQHLYGILLYSIRIHQKELIKFTHKILLSATFFVSHTRFCTY